MMPHNDILKSWLRTLRYCIESYEDSYYEQPLKNYNMVNSDGCNDVTYVNLWDCSDKKSYQRPCESLNKNDEFLKSETTDWNNYASKIKKCKKPIPTPRQNTHSKWPEHKTSTGNEFQHRYSSFESSPIYGNPNTQSPDNNEKKSVSSYEIKIRTGRIKSLPLIWNFTEERSCDDEYPSLNFAKEIELNSDFEEEILKEISALSQEKLSIIEKQPAEKLRESIIFWILTIQKECSEEVNDILEKKELLESHNQDSRDSAEKSGDQPIALSYSDNSTNRKTSENLDNSAGSTTDFNDGISQEESYSKAKGFEIRGIVMIEIVGFDKPILTKWKEEYVMYKNENFYRVNERTKKKQKLLSSNVLIKSIRYPKYKESKEVELVDSRNNVYILHFQEISFSRRFMENDKLQNFNTDNKSNIRRALLRFIGKRSSREFLEKKGIYKNEPIFGNTLREIHAKSGSGVPEFVTEVISLLEKPENIESLGMYRASGNLAIIQKIRCEVDNGTLGILAQYEKDPDVLAGSLKLFFRELKEPLVPFDICVKLSELTESSVDKMPIRKLQKIRSVLTENLCASNLKTFIVLMRHLLEVIKLKEYNKMDAYNLAICWGPTMIFSTQEDQTALETSENIVAQSQAATRLTSFFLAYYELHPSELDELDRNQ